MEVTYNIKAIIINRYDFREKDSKVILYSDTEGKLELVARGTKNIKSKLVSHIEPITLANIMVVKGKQYDYIGSVIGENYFSNIKKSFNRLEIAGKFLSFYNKEIKFGETLDSKDYFNLLLSFLNLINDKNLKVNLNLIYSIFLYKILIIFGLKQELYICNNCKNKLTPKNNKIIFNKGGIVCPKCSHKFKESQFISDETIKLLRLSEKVEVKKVNILKIRDNIINEFESIINKIYIYNK